MTCGHGCTTGAVMSENAVSVPSDSLLVLDAIEVVAEHLLEPVTVQDSICHYLFRVDCTSVQIFG